MIEAKSETKQTDWPELVGHRILFRSCTGSRIFEAEVLEVSARGLVKIQTRNGRANRAFTWLRPDAISFIEDLGRVKNAES